VADPTYLPAVRQGPWYRAIAAVSGFYRASLAAMGVSKTPPMRPGASSGQVASRPLAEQHLQQMALSPAVYAAIQRRTRTMGDYPIIVLVDGKPVPGKSAPWVGELLHLLATPDSEELSARGDPEGLAPIEPGEGLIAQLVADLLLEGVAYVIPTAGSRNRVSGLTRAHPRLMRLANGGAHWHYAQQGRVTVYPRRGVFCLRTVSWQASGQGELGTGAGEVLEPLVAAERSAMVKTAQIIDQGGADVIVTSKSATGQQFLANPANRDRVREDLQTMLGMRDGGRVVVIGGDLEAKPSGLTPGDIQAPALIEAARGSELMALGVTPVSIGMSDAVYATAALQYRVQAELDESLASIFEAYLLRPLAQHYARVSGMGLAQVATVTARIDLSTHPGYAYARTEAIDRMTKLVDLGYSTEQAAIIEAQTFPPPAGPPRAKTAPQAGAPGGEPKPIGEGGGGQRLAVIHGGRERADSEGD